MKLLGWKTKAQSSKILKFRGENEGGIFENIALKLITAWLDKS